MSNQLRRTNRAVLGTLAMILAVSVQTAHSEQTPGAGRPRDVFGGYASTQIVVKLRNEALATPAARQHFRTARHDADPRAALSGPLRSAASSWRTKRMRPAFSEPFADPAAAARHGLDRTFIIEVPEGTDTQAMAVAFAELREDIEVATVDTIGGVADVFPNDTNFNLQYAMHNTGQTILGQSGTPDADIDAPEAWALHTGDFGTVTIAIIDSGVNSHSEFGINAPPYPNGRIVQGHNTANPLTPNATADGCPHGTHVAGIAAASGNNNLGVAGVTWGAYIMPVRVLRDPPGNGCVGVVSALADGIKWAADHGADVGNMSLQYYGLSQSEYNMLNEAIDYAHDLGMILIAATGNTPNGPSITYVAYPARLPNCMAVSATDNRDNLASFSHYGNEVDVSAPGDDVYSTWGGVYTQTNGYAYLYGTSMATPHVSGLAALIKSYVPQLTNFDLERILMFSADDKGPVGWDTQYGFGRINAHNALLAADAWRGVVLSSSPPHAAIDARKPTDRDGANTYGWQSVDLTMTVYAAVQTPADFLVTQEGGVVVAPAITGVAATDDTHVSLTFKTIIETRAWTTITHLSSGSSIRLGYLPGDVNADHVSNGTDVTALVDTLNGVAPAKPIWSMDIDQSLTITGADALEVVDLLNGAEAYEAYLGATLP